MTSAEKIQQLEFRKKGYQKIKKDLAQQLQKLKNSETVDEAYYGEIPPIPSEAREGLVKCLSIIDKHLHNLKDRIKLLRYK